ncbi:MAG: HEAT repeat domain-containing protein [Gammaproteobacteria bacterium]|nr:HEAT repeat domain-containing protein [Gammaproteobacteria bacterium]
MCSWMMSVLLFLISLFMFHPSISATPKTPLSDLYVVDMFGDDSALGHAILKKYRQAVMQYTQLGVKGLNPSRAVFKQIKAEGHYVYARQNVVFYPDMPQSYITIEVITQKERDRLHWVTSRDNLPPPLIRHDVVELMQKYNDLGISLLKSHQLKLSDVTDCHPNHCLFGFRLPQLKPYRRQFETGIRLEKDTILKALNDPDPRRREAAAYVVGEFSNPQEIMSLLLSHVQDKDNGVRNAAMRVIFDTMRHAKLSRIDVHPFIQLLRSPYETDRNKALCVLLMAMERVENKKIIQKEALTDLQKLAKLKQPNNRDFALHILEKLGIPTSRSHDVGI